MASSEDPAPTRRRRNAAKTSLEDAADAKKSRGAAADGPGKPPPSRGKAAPVAAESPTDEQPKRSRTPKAATPEAAEARAAPEAAAADAPPAEGGAAPRHALDGLPGASLLPEKMAENIGRIEELSMRLMQALAQRRSPAAGVQGPGADFYVTAAQAWARNWVEDPVKVIQAQTRYWGETLRHYAEVQGEFARGRLSAPPDEGPADPRFKNPLWSSNPWFAFLKRQYKINADALARSVADLEVDDPVAKRRIAWFSRQIIDMMSPTNFLATNPDALEKAIETEGESLVRGLENLVADVESGQGELMVSLVDKSAFTVGENIATTPGEVVLQDRMFELIQYAPTTDKVHALPLILFPPWINKFYILDMKPQNSLIKYLVDKGLTLFVVSWKNPDASMNDTGMEDYVAAQIRAMDEVLARTGQDKLNVVGYCIGGTALSMGLGVLKARGDERVNSATFFTTLTDFSELGEFTTFLQDDFLSGIDEEVARTGVLGAQLMARTFSFLRANDLIWGPAIRSYMLGETPPAFDLLYWNADATNLPGRMAVEYLRGICVTNAFATDEGLEVLGERVRLSDIDLPMCSIACEGDHIAPWLDCWRGFSKTGAEDRTFILSQSGHIAGIINPPNRIKYGHYTSEAGFDATAKDWREGAAFHEGSWWPTWTEWLTPRSGQMVTAREPEGGIAPAPGSYVHESAT
ncbi:class I poly(R)-hydroxyalkanoic acid synthase [Paracoccus sp. S-4012]|uniref:class I poly(R)-hydroxyalkanoic acid synthase n=1 Tax=Paracoccus sp. S-4012 TaxID=2665648 RepID=UPI0012B13DB5|nr:class I poly(R)-hydroxyalkanoic acid synthase [Paracoccus sp. S-4012]MRX51863.1 class I poly(R)-hydroxyalkanoic acid synthase [Paracoccus sp. S-4012]